MPYLHDDVHDDGLQVLTDATTVLHICSAGALTDRASVLAASLGNDSVSIGAPEDGDTSGRKVRIPAITAGSVTGTGTAAQWAVVDGTRHLASQDLASTQAVTNGNPFTLAATDIELPDPA